jgi:hypothetical protein
LEWNMFWSWVLVLWSISSGVSLCEILCALLWENNWTSYWSLWFTLPWRLIACGHRRQTRRKEMGVILLACSSIVELIKDIIWDKRVEDGKILCVWVSCWVLNQFLS